MRFIFWGFVLGFMVLVTFAMNNFEKKKYDLNECVACDDYECVKLYCQDKTETRGQSCVEDCMDLIYYK